MVQRQKIILAFVLFGAGAFLLGSGLSDFRHLTSDACLSADDLPAMGALEADLSAPIRYDLPRVAETVAPPAARQGDARVIVEFIDPRAVALSCAGAVVVSGTYGEALGCTRMTPGRVTMIVPNPCAFWWDDYAALLCHELGHVNGWRHGREDDL